jgi:hypothetical protein
MYFVVVAAVLEAALAVILVVALVLPAAVVVVGIVVMSDRVAELWRDNSQLQNADPNELRAHQSHQKSDKESTEREKREDDHHRNQRQLLGVTQRIDEESGELDPRLE